SMPGMRRTERSRARLDRSAARPPIGSAAASSSEVASRMATIRLAPPKGAPLTAKHPSHYITPMDFETIRLERADGVATITLHRPERLNAWTPVMGRELLDAFRAADRDRDVRAVILTGAGRAFCAGADMEFFAGQIRAGGGTGAAGGDGPGRVEEFPALMQQMSKPTIAAINGYALGVGCTMTLLCDVRLASVDAKMGFLFPRMGVMAELGSTFLLPRLVGLGRACELMFTGKQY